MKRTGQRGQVSKWWHGVALVYAGLALAAPWHAMAEPVPAPDSGSVAPKPPSPPAPPHLGVVAVPAPRERAAPRAPVLKGAPSGTVRTVSLEVEDESVRSILVDLADQAKWDLVVSLPEPVAERELTLRVHARPATEALEAVLNATSLTAEFKGNVLTVRADHEALASAIKARMSERGDGDDDEDQADDDSKSSDAGEAARDMREARRDAVQAVREAKQQAAAAAREARHALKHHGGDRDDDRVSIGHPLTIGPEETVQSAVVVGAPLLVRGHVLEDAVVIGGPLRLEDGATVEGEAVAIGGPVDIAEGARVRGNTLSFGGPAGGLASFVVRLMSGRADARSALLFNTLWVLLRAVALFVIAILFVSFAPDRVKRVREMLLARPGASTAAGLAVLIGTLPLLVLLLVSLVGIPLIPVAIVVLLALPALGMTAVLTWVGDRVPLWAGRKTQLGAMLIGLGLVILVDLIPVLGVIILFAVTMVATGAAVLSRFGAPPKTAMTPAPAAPASNAQ